MFYLENDRESFYQWDSNQRLIVTDASITNLHYCNRTEAEALVVEVYEEEGKRFANVPNILLQDVWNICVYAYCGNCYTKQSKLFKVIARSKPADYIYTETEVLRWATLEAEIKAEMAALEAKVDSKLVDQNTKVANAIVGTVSGAEGVIKGVSPLPHTMEITAEPNTTVTLWGKNLFDVTPVKGKTVKMNGGTLHCDENGYITGSGTPTGGCAFENYRLDNLPKNTLMVLSAHGTSKNLAAVLYLRDKDGKQLGVSGVDSSKPQASVKPYDYPTFDYATVEIKRSGNNSEMSGGMYIQLEIGNKRSDYVPCVSPITYTANEEGVIEGATSPSTTVTYVADNETTIKYNRDANEVIKELTEAIISLGGNI